MDHPRLTIARTGHGDAGPRAGTASDDARAHPVIRRMGSSDVASRLSAQPTGDGAHARPIARPLSSGSGG